MVDDRPLLRGGNTMSKTANSIDIESHVEAIPGIGAPPAGGLINVKQSRFPYCIVWSPLPLISWFLPMIGHLGICNSAGIIYDFGGPYFIAEDHMTFGRPTRYYRLSPSRVSLLEWDRGVHLANDEYRGRMHNLFCDNCHSHVAYALNKMGYRGKTNWNMLILGWEMFVFGSFTSFGGFLRTWLPFLVLVLIIVMVTSTATATD
eukprot:m.68288 g.68288  ORF g.68288 m.68288 type:complete len:204 (-) comp15983_c0_seq1:29-640(-)